MEFNWYLRSQLLRQSDWAGMAHSLEIRLPLVDKDLFNRIAPLVINGSLTKKDLGRSPSKPLPQQVLAQRKQIFRVPVREWLMEVVPSRTGQASFSRRGLREWSQLVFAEFSRSAG
jgi:asparagine synthase (glutamine-hydrolysing)